VAADTGNCLTGRTSSRRSRSTAVADEVEIFKSAYMTRIPVILKGPTGCGKTRFFEHMAWRLGKEGGALLPLVTVACHEDLTAGDLVGRFILQADETVWIDGPLTAAVKAGAICYLDEVVEARKDTLVLIHPLVDHKRILPVEKNGTVLCAHPRFLLVVSYNPGYQSLLKDLKISTRQRFVAIDFHYPPLSVETEIVSREASVSGELAGSLALIGHITYQAAGYVIRHATAPLQANGRGGKTSFRLPTPKYFLLFSAVLKPLNTRSRIETMKQ